MTLLQSFKMALASIWGNKMRSFLTMLGVIIGIFAVVVLVSLGEGATSQITVEFEKMGTNLLNISVSNPRKGLSDEQVRKIGELDGVLVYAPILQGNMTARGGGETSGTTVYGTTPSYLEVQEYKLYKGRNISTTDAENRFMVAVVGTELADEIFGYRDVIGESFRINGRTFKVIGVVEEQEDSMFGSANNFVILPIETAARMMKSTDIRQIVMRAVDSDAVEELQAAVERNLKKMTGEDNYNIFSSKNLLDSLDSAMGTMVLMLGGIAAISLLVGGIGIMNIMLVSVTERTREIGIRKAIGAKRADILLQFLIEALVITMIGGVLSLGVSQLALMALSGYMKIELTMAPQTVMMGIGFCLFIGLVFGVYPANKASKLDPIQALRHE